MTSHTQREAFQPSEEWIDAFKTQCTDALRLDLRAYARRRARGVGRAGARVDDAYADDLVANALADTLFGTVAWDPAGKTLHQHAEDTIRYRTRHDRQRARRFSHAHLEQDAIGIEASLDASIFAAEVIAQIRALAAGDRPVLAFLDAISAGAQKRTEIMEATRMSLKTFRNARDRLTRLVDELDHRVVAAARNLPRGARA